MKRRKKPSKTRRHRESVAAKRKARAFYRLRNRKGKVPSYDTAMAILKAILIIVWITAIAFCVTMN